MNDTISVVLVVRTYALKRTFRVVKKGIVSRSGGSKIFDAKHLQIQLYVGKRSLCGLFQVIVSVDVYDEIAQIFDVTG